MILYRGVIYDNQEQNRLLDSLKDDIYETLKTTKYPSIETVINACDQLAKQVLNHKYDDIAVPLLNALNIPYSMLEQYVSYFAKAGLQKKVEIELGDLLKGDINLDKNTVRSYRPLGVIFHVAAGNVDLLPAYTVIEGLLVGNINILKLPTGDNGLSLTLLKALIDIEPSLKDYIYVFDIPSVEIESIKRLSLLSDATVVWGGEAVSKAAREFVDIHSSLIVWGHKISFSYVDENVTDEELEKLAESICLSNQLLCSSSQGIYLNTSDVKECHVLAKRFLPILAKVSQRLNTLPLTMKAKNTLLNYNEKLEDNSDNIYQQDGVSIRVSEEQKLELSYLYQNVWIKPLAKDEIISVLKENKNLLQTVSINRKIKDKEEIIDSLLKAGLVRIVNLGDNSRMINGEAHDGEYPLRRYIRIVEKVA